MTFNSASTENSILNEIIRKFSSYPNSLDRIVDLYNKNKDGDLLLHDKFIRKISNEFIFPDDATLKFFKKKEDAMFWGQYKLKNIFLKYNNEKLGYFTEKKQNGAGLWVLSSSCICASERKGHLTPYEVFLYP